MNVLWVTNVPSPYRNRFFNKLSEQCNLHVVFEKKHSDERDSSWRSEKNISFNFQVLKGLKYSPDKTVSISVCFLPFKQYDKIIISNPFTLTGMILTTYLKIRGISFIIEGDGGGEKKESKFKRLVKSFLLKGAVAYFSTGKSHDKYYMQYKINSKNIVRYSFSSFSSDYVNKLMKTEDEKTMSKLALGMEDKFTVLFVGSFIYRKGLDVLLKTMQNVHDDIVLYCIGGGETKHYLGLIDEHQLDKVHFLPFQNEEKIKEYYESADVFVLPTREDIWGLVINESMASGTPVITTRNCVAGNEIIINGYNGFIVEPENDLEIADKVNLLYNDENLRYQIGYNALESIRKYTIENMVKDHINYLFKETSQDV